MDPCVFCRMLAGELPSSPVLDGDLVVAFLDIHPWNSGHTLVVPRRHVGSFTELSPTEVEHLALCGQRIATALKHGFDGCEAVTVSLADGAAAGQDVPHSHLHVVPPTNRGWARLASGRSAPRPRDAGRHRLSPQGRSWHRFTGWSSKTEHDPFTTDCYAPGQSPECLDRNLPVGASPSRASRPPPAAPSRRPATWPRRGRAGRGRRCGSCRRASRCLPRGPRAGRSGPGRA